MKGYIYANNKNSFRMRMGHLVGGIDRVELVVMRVRSSTHQWKGNEFYDKG
jgi:hypothetical protein